LVLTPICAPAIVSPLTTTRVVVAHLPGPVRLRQPARMTILRTSIEPVQSLMDLPALARLLPVLGSLLEVRALELRP
jgi:hypothetical protein